jgi:hypothetical protein
VGRSSGSIRTQKIVRVGTYQISGLFDLFNATNSSYIKSQNITFGPQLGRSLDSLNPRTLRVAAQFRF